MKEKKADKFWKALHALYDAGGIVTQLGVTAGTLKQLLEDDSVVGEGEALILKCEYNGKTNNIRLILV